MERHDHINPWADKLQDIPVPEMNDAWKAMESLLEEEMPYRGKRDRRRWLLLIILLLLLIGVCNCPGRMRRYTGLGENGSGQREKLMDSSIDAGKRMVERAGPESRETMGSGGGKGKNAGVSLQKDDEESRGIRGKDGSQAGNEQMRSSTADRKHRGSNINREAEENDTKNVGKSAKKKYEGSNIKREVDEDSISRRKDGNEAGSKKIVSRSAKGKRSGGNIESEKKREGQVTEQEKKGNASREKIKGAPGEDSERSPEEEQAQGIAGNKAKTDERKEPVGHEPAAVPPGKAGDPVARDNRKDTVATVKKAVTKKMLAQKRADSLAAAEKKADSMKADKKGWVAGIGLNQFFTVGQQEQSNYNSSGTTGGIRDYIPVPMIRYYFSNKLFIQLEAQFNTPQYTKKDLLASESKVDTTSIPTAKLQSVLYIKKLFYFNVPLSVHFSPFPNFYVGAGLQYSRLTNGVGLFQDKASPRYTSGGDTIKTSKVQSFKNDTTYQKMKTNELRLLLDLSYTYKKLIIGARYNRALSNFIDVRLSDSQVSQSRNSSIQIYLRYILWDGRKKKLSAK